MKKRTLLAAASACLTVAYTLMFFYVRKSSHYSMGAATDHWTVAAFTDLGVFTRIIVFYFINN